MKKRQRKRKAAQRSPSEPSDASPSIPESVPRRMPRSRIIYSVATGLAVLLVVGGLVRWRQSSIADGFENSASDDVAILTDSDEPKIREVCSHCHQLPTPDVLPRAAWEETIWQMFHDSGYGTTVKWRVDPQALVAWYEQRAPEQFDFPETKTQLAAAGSLPVVKKPISVQVTTSAPVVSNILVADVVGDRQAELIVCDMLNGEILMGTDEANWELEPIAEVANPAHVEAIDLDQDGRTDLVVANLGSFLAMDHNLGSIEWLRQGDDNTFERFTLADGLSRAADVQPDDFDGDGDLDLVVAEFGWRATGHLLLLENQTPAGHAPVFEVRELDGLHGASHVDVTDLDGDGLRDIVVLYSQGHEMVRCYVHRGEFVFAIHDLYRAPSPAWGFSGSQLVDLDGDDDLDILLTNGDTFDNSILKPYHGVQWLENQGELKFEPHKLGTLYGAYRAEAADMDGDGDVDVVACALITPQAQKTPQLGDHHDSIVWFEQIAAREFVRHTLESDQFHHPTLALSDYDLDGDVDLLVGNGQLHATVVPTAQSCIDLWENQSHQRGDSQ